MHDAGAQVAHQARQVEHPDPDIEQDEHQREGDRSEGHLRECQPTLERQEHDPGESQPAGIEDPVGQRPDPAVKAQR